MTVRKNKRRIAAIQMVSTADVDKNLQVVEKLVQQAAEQGACLLVLPENFATFALRDIGDIARTEQTPQGPLRCFMSELAAKHGVFLLGGTVPVATGNSDKYLASSFCYDPSGNEIARYNKIHLFDAYVSDAHSSYRESDLYQHGTDVVAVDTGTFKTGLAVCYDLRFPELFHQLRQLQTQLVVLPSAFTYVTGQKHWQILLQARAIENQCYILGANQGGWHDEKRRTWGHSMIVSPDGQVLASMEEGEGVVVADMDLRLLEEIRGQMPVSLHHRL